MYSMSFLPALLCVGIVYANPKPTEPYIHNATLKRNEYVLYWKFTPTNITFEIQAKTTGWVGLGISENANMIGADISVGWVKKENVTITDRHGGTANGYPAKDSRQDLKLILGRECNGWTIIKFTRQLGRCENGTDREITSSTTRVIWAFGRNDPDGNDISYSDIHATQNRGSSSLYLLENPPNRPFPTDDGRMYSKMDIRANNFVIPNTKTYYNCILFKLPIQEKRHILKVSPIITSGNERLVHHMLMYSCGQTIPNEAEIGANSRCYGANMAYYQSCSTLLAAWAIGGSEFIYSNDAGLPVGGSSDPLYVQLEIHYDNPDSLSGVKDSSGLQLTHTGNLFPNEIGIWQIGSTVGSLTNIIPPKASAYLNVGVCTGSCISNAMTEAGITEVTSVAVMLHSHLAGRKMSLRHIRNGTELEPVFDNAYDFDYQEVRILNPPRTIQSADQFRMECTYSTKERTKLTVTGIDTNDEMCLGFVFYYPKIDLAKCESEPDIGAAGNFFGIQGIRGSGSIYSVTVTAPASLSGQSIGQVVDNYSWTEEKIHEFSKVQTSAKQKQICQKQDKSSKITTSEDVPIIPEQFVLRPKTCSSAGNTHSPILPVDSCTNSSISSFKTQIYQSRLLFVVIAIISVSYDSHYCHQC